MSRVVSSMALLGLLLAPTAGWADTAADAAIERAEAWVEREPESVSARCELAEAYLHKYDMAGDEAALLFATVTGEQAVELDGQSARAQATLARVYQVQGRTEAALRHAEAALEIHPGHPEASRVSREGGRPVAPPAPAAPPPPRPHAPRAEPPPPTTTPRAAPPAPAREAPAPRPDPPTPAPRVAPTPPPPSPARVSPPMTGGGGGVPAGSTGTPPWVLAFAGALALGIVVLCSLLIRLLRLRSQGAKITVPGRGRVTLSAYTTTIGRAAGNRIRLTDPEVSARHAEIYFSAGAFRIRDLGSRNGIRVNGQPVTEQALQTGDEMVIGTTTLRFTAERPA